MDGADFERRIAGLASLHEPMRRRLYAYVASRGTDVSRDEAAAALGVSRALAGFHLDRLAQEGLLQTSFRRLSGKTGPGAGRPAKLYRRAQGDVCVSLPQRNYEMAARILANAAAASGTESAVTSAARAAGERMVELGERAGPERAGNRPLEVAMAVLAANGYEPFRDGEEVRLRNCPFHQLAAEHRELVCGMNLALLGGVASALELPDGTVALDPKPGMCCVTLRFPASESA